VNALLPERFTSDECDQIAAANGSHPVPGVRAALRAAQTEYAQAKSQRSQLRRLKREAGAPVATLPYLFEADLDLDSFERLSVELERRIAA
jgi:hypothetical protein